MFSADSRMDHGLINQVYIKIQYVIKSELITVVIYCTTFVDIPIYTDSLM